MREDVESPITTTNALIFYDGTCATCQGFIRFLLNRDKKRFFRYASLQGETAQRLLPRRYYDIDSLVYFAPMTKIFTDQSTAVLTILEQLGGVYRLVGRLGRLVPRPFRDFVYKQWARQRHRFKAHCRLLSDEERRLFLP